MKSRSLLRRFTLVLAISGWLAGHICAQTKAPVIALMDPSDAAQWRDWVSGLGWRVAADETAQPNVDERVLGLEKVVRRMLEDPGVDSSRVYLVGRGPSSAAIFYAASRVPELWAAAVMVGGSPQEAIDTGRVFSANLSHVPVLWAGAGTDDPALAEKIKAAGVNLEFRPKAGLTGSELEEWLMPRTRQEFPATVDCEATALAFGHCYWTEVVKFDPLERNDLLRSTQLKPRSGAVLQLQGFRYSPDDPGPGLTITSVEPAFATRVRAGDRITALDGKPIDNARQFEKTLETVTEERPAVVMVEHGKDRRRIDTRIVVPKRDPVVTARVQAKYDAGTDSIEIISRQVSALRVTAPRQWVPVEVNWNGLGMEKLTEPGCVELWIEKELLRSGKCR
jgi:dienelactone hydrolase